MNEDLAPRGIPSPSLVFNRLSSNRAFSVAAVLGASVSVLAFKPSNAEAGGSVDVAVNVGTPPYFDGSVPITITNNGAECTLVDFNLSESSSSGGSSSSSESDIQDTIQPGDTENIEIGGSDIGGNVTLNAYDCSDLSETSPLVPSINFILDQPPYSYSLASPGSNNGSSQSSITTSSTSVSSQQTETTTTSSSSSENCKVPKVTKYESIKQAAHSLVAANCALAPSTYALLSKRQREEGYRWVVTKYVYVNKHKPSQATAEQANKLLPFGFPLTAIGKVIRIK